VFLDVGETTDISIPLIMQNRTRLAPILPGFGQSPEGRHLAQATTSPSRIPVDTRNPGALTVQGRPFSMLVAGTTHAIIAKFPLGMDVIPFSATVVVAAHPVDSESKMIG
jgi:hypothetical protein